LTDARGEKLSKRAGALSLRVLRAQGLSPAEAFRRAGLELDRLSFDRPRDRPQT
jgi:glutamyl/glutaminyl-tRNA synthetase